jgi:hypothetical protein
VKRGGPWGVGVGCRVAVALKSTLESSEVKSRYLEVDAQVGDSLALARCRRVGDGELRVGHLLQELGAHRTRGTEDCNRDLRRREGERHCQVKSSQVQPSQVEPSCAKPSQAKPSQVTPSHATPCVGVREGTRSSQVRSSHVTPRHAKSHLSVGEGEGGVCGTQRALAVL